MYSEENKTSCSVSLWFTDKPSNQAVCRFRSCGRCVLNINVTWASHCMSAFLSLTSRGWWDIRGSAHRVMPPCRILAVVFLFYVKIDKLFVFIVWKKTNMSMTFYKDYNEESTLNCGCSLTQKVIIYYLLLFSLWLYMFYPKGDDVQSVSRRKFTKSRWIHSDVIDSCRVCWSPTPNSCIVGKVGFSLSLTLSLAVTFSLSLKISATV